MITRFRVEGENESKDILIEELLKSVGVIIGFVSSPGIDGMWECTDDVNSWSAEKQKYIGRMVMLFHTGEPEFHDN